MTFEQDNKDVLIEFQYTPNIIAAMKILRPGSIFQTCTFTDMYSSDYVSRAIIEMTDGTERPSNAEIQYVLDQIKALRLMYLLRKVRDQALRDSDIYVLPDYPISQENLNTIKAYRQSLRDLPNTLIANQTVIDIDNLQSYLPSKPACIS